LTLEADTVREYPERPIVGVGAVVIDDGRVLLVRRGNEPLKGEWSLPGGAVEVGETLEVATAREIREETGLEIEVGPMVDVLDRIRFDVDGRVLYHYVLIDFLCRPTGGALCCASDAADASWAAIVDLPQFGLADATLTVIHKALDRAGAGPWMPREVHWGEL
jgi:8-oxo-dGTP diphosphatase